MQLIDSKYFKSYRDKFGFSSQGSLKDYLSANEINSYKKKAIEISIQQSNGELIVTSDADCIFPKNWLTTIASFYESKRPAFIVMPVFISYGKKMIEVFNDLSM